MCTACGQFLKKVGKTCYLVTLRWNGNEQTSCGEPMNYVRPGYFMHMTHSLISSCWHWRTWFRQVFVELYFRYCLIYHRKHWCGKVAFVCNACIINTKTLNSWIITHQFSGPLDNLERCQKTSKRHGMQNAHQFRHAHLSEQIQYIK